MYSRLTAILHSSSFSLLMLLVVCLVEAGWMISNGLPFPGTDDLEFKQAGFELVSNGRFAAPALEGYYRGLEKVFLITPPLYPLTFALWISLFGFSLKSSITFGFVLRLLSTMALYVLVRKIHPFLSHWWAVLTAGSYFFLPDYMDRPEALTTALGLFALLIVCSHPDRQGLLRGLMIGVLLGCACSAQPIVGGLYTIYVCASLMGASSSGKTGIRRVTHVIAASVLTFLLIWSPLVLQNLEYFYHQFIQLFLKNIGWSTKATIGSKVWAISKWHTPLVFVFLLSGLIYCFTEREPFRRRFYLWQAGGVIAIILLSILFVPLKDTYHAALIPLIFVFGIGGIPSLKWRSGKPFRISSAASGMVAYFTLLIASFFLYLLPSIRINLFPLTWTREDTYTYTLKRLHEQIPPGASVLVGSTLWYALAGRSVIYDGFFVWHAKMKECDYIVSVNNGSGISGRPMLYKDDQMKEYRERNFVVVDSTLTPEPNRLIKIPISRFRWSYRFILYQRKSVYE